MWLALALSGVLGALWRQSRRGELLAWAAGFALFGAKLGVGLASLEAQASRASAWLGHGLAAGALMLIALGVFRATAPEARPALSTRDPRTIARIALVFVALLLHLHLGLRVLTFLLVWHAVVAFVRDRRSTPRLILAFGMTFAAVTGLASLWLPLRPDHLLWAFAAAVIPWIAIAAGVLLVHFDRLQRG